MFTSDRHLAEDVIQEAVIRTYNNWETARAAPNAYIRTVIRNLFVDHSRAVAVRPAEVPLEELPEIGYRPHDSFEDREVVRAVLEQLPPGYRNVLALRMIEGWSVRETARGLGCTSGTVKSQTSKAMNAFRAALEAEQARQPPEGRP